jgi:hypothetical protein
MKLRESNLEKENIFKVKEKAKISKEIFENMRPQMKINRPLGNKIKNDKKISKIFYFFNII